MMETIQFDCDQKTLSELTSQLIDLHGPALVTLVILPAQKGHFHVLITKKAKRK